MENNTQSRKWALVINNPLEAGLDHAAIREILRRFAPSYFCMADEVASGDIFLEDKYLFPVCCALAARLRPSIFPDGRNAGGLCGELDMPLRLISGHLKVGKLDLNKAFRLFHELLTVNADTDFLKAVCRPPLPHGKYYRGAAR